MSSKDELILKYLEKIDGQTEKIDQKVEKVDAKCDAIDKRQAVHEAHMKTRLDKYNQELERHIEGVEQNRTWNTTQDSRIAALEQPSDASTTFKTLSKWTVLGGKIAVAALAIWKAVEFILPYLLKFNKNSLKIQIQHYCIEKHIPPKNAII